MTQISAVNSRKLISTRDSESRLFLDATSALRWGQSVPTGIPRIEASMISECLKNRSDQFDLFAFDPTIRRCRTLTENEKLFVRSSLEPRPASAGQAGPAKWSSRLRRAYSLYRLNIYCTSRETYRTIAQDLLASNRRTGIIHNITKTGVRIAFRCGRTWRAITRAADRRALPDPLASGRARCLLSINTSPFIAKYYRVEDIGCRLLILNYDTIPLDYPDYASRGHAERFRRYFSSGMSVADEIICISEATGRSTLEWCAKLGIETSGKPLHIVRVASPLASSRILPSPVEDLKNKRFIVYCSTIEPRKNHQMLLQVWARLYKRFGREALPSLILVGKWGWRIDDVKQFLKDNGYFGDSVKVYSYLPDEQLIWLYENALFSVFPSIVEGWGLAASESLDFGTPALISDAPALLEATQGIMPRLDANDAGAWEERIAQLIFDDGATVHLREKIRCEYVRRSPADVFREISVILGGRAAGDR